MPAFSGTRKILVHSPLMKVVSFKSVSTATYSHTLPLCTRNRTIGFTSGFVSVLYIMLIEIIRMLEDLQMHIYMYGHHIPVIVRWRTRQERTHRQYAILTLASSQNLCPMTMKPFFPPPVFPHFYRLFLFMPIRGRPSFSSFTLIIISIITL